MEILEKRYILKNTTRENVMEHISLACRIPRNVLLSTVDSFESRVQSCVNNNGQIFEHLLRSKSFHVKTTF